MSTYPLSINSYFRFVIDSSKVQENPIVSFGTIIKSLAIPEVALVIIKFVILCVPIAWHLQSRRPVKCVFKQPGLFRGKRAVCEECPSVRQGRIVCLLETYKLRVDNVLPLSVKTYALSAGDVYYLWICLCHHEDSKKRAYES